MTKSETTPPKPEPITPKPEPTTPVVPTPQDPITPKPITPEPEQKPEPKPEPITPVAPTPTKPITPKREQPENNEPEPITPVAPTPTKPITPVAPTPPEQEPKTPVVPTPPEQEPKTPVVPTPQEPITPKPEPITPVAPTILKHKQPENNDVEEQIKALLDKEYKIVHGIEPDEEERERYRNLVQEERKKNNLETDSELAYMKKRMLKFIKTLRDNTAPIDNAEGFCDTNEGKDRINRTRQLMWQTNLASDGEVLESKDVTLLHFRELVPEVINKGKSPNAAAARDSRRAPPPLGKGNRPSDRVLDVTPKLEGAKKQYKPMVIPKGKSR